MTQAEIARRTGSSQPEISRFLCFRGTTPWEFTVNDPSRLDMGPLRDLGGRWVLVDERGEARALVDGQDPHDSCGLCYDQRIRRGG